MIRELELTAFKCFGKAAFSFGPLTLLAGVNGGGKSTIVQSILLLHQALSSTDGSFRSDLPLSGPLTSLGTVRDVIDRERGGKRFAIGMGTSEVRVDWTLTSLTSPKDELTAKLSRTNWKAVSDTGAAKHGTTLFPAELLLSDAGRSLHSALVNARYVPADRIGPAEAYPLVEAAAHRSLGPRAERAIGALYWGRDIDVVPEMRHPSKPHSQLDRQAEAWLRDLFPRVVQLQVLPVERANLVTLGVAFDEGDLLRSHNIGFGMTYALPIIVALLSAQPGELVLIDSPEAHLHPRAQVAITRLAIVAANAGIQVVLETHSDHVLNAIRVAVYRDLISRRDVRVHFFQAKGLDDEPFFREIKLDKHGGLADRPDGFFDEIDRQLMALIEPTVPDA